MSRLILSLTKALLGIVLFLGLPLLGWGILDIRGFVVSGAHVAYATAVIFLQVFVVVVFPGIGGGSGEGVDTVQRQRVAVLLLQVLTVAVVTVAGYSDHRTLLPIGGSGILRYLGVLLYGLGTLMVSWVEWSLGKEFSVQVTIQQDHELIMGGPFGFIRHPRYLGILIFTLGVSLAFNSWVSVGVVVAILLVLLWRIGDEERLMRDHFGAEWEAYSLRTRRLIPFLY